MSPLKVLNGQTEHIARVIERVGFPAFAFLVMCVVCFYSLEKMTAAVSENTKALIEFSATTRSFQAAVVAAHEHMLQDLGTLKERSASSTR